MTPALTLFLIIFLEGYVVLSTELLAIRMLLPFTGSGTDTISVIIAAVLMPLAFGYYAGGQFKTRKNGIHKSTVRQKLLYNLTVSGMILTAGLSYPVLNQIFAMLYIGMNWANQQLFTTIYALIFLVYPVFLLGQTVPLLSNYFPRSRLPVMTGRILFFSTIGSFMGSVFCTLVLMTFLGVHYAVLVTICCISVLIILLSKNIISRSTLYAAAIALAALGLNNGYMMRLHKIVANNAYHTISIDEFGTSRILRLNGNTSAVLDKSTGQPYAEYARFIERTFIDPLIWNHKPPSDILVIGAGGFTTGKTDNKNNYIYIDIDPVLKDIAEQKFLEEQIGRNKHFEPTPIRAYLNKTDQKFDLIILDVFHGPSKTPEHLVTREFFQQVKDALKPGGMMAGNYIATANFTDDFSINLDNTIRSVLSPLNRQVVSDYDAWNKRPQSVNVIYSYRNNPDAPRDIYTDNKNRSVFDKPKKN
ncbi:MAG: fused MFS/spermidine synthase [Rhodospirillales bacterium]|nr:fused MFS/spermidine synthase [Rhodospirillales bacterium]MCB9995080.1 fused MFS/spermidine synthase [Rhodospirillales bacterium]